MSSPAPLLHVFLITYNREKSFRRTLEAFASSGLREMPVTVLDNCSSDGTPAVCEEFRRKLPLMDVRRHPRNIGFGANFLRAIELSTGQYTWIVADDDTLFLEHLPALLDVLRDGSAAGVFVGGPRQDEWPAGRIVSPLEIQRSRRTFLTGQSFAPAVVFKTSIVGSREMSDGYFGIRTNFPQLTIGRKLLIDDLPCAVLRPPLIRRDDPAEKPTGYLNVIDGWTEFTLSLPPGLRRDAFYSVFVRPDARGMVRELARMILWAKVEGGERPGYRIARISLNAPLDAKAALIACRLLCLLPGGVYHLARETYRKVKYQWLRRPLPPNYHAPILEDDLRR